jgi:hypothetical protein
MANLPISGLAAGAAVSSTDLFPDVQVVGVGPVKVTAAQIGEYVLSGAGLTGILPVAHGGTGLSSLAANRIAYGNGTGAFNSSANFKYDGTNLLINSADGTASISNAQNEYKSTTAYSPYITLTNEAGDATGGYFTLKKARDNLFAPVQVNDALGTIQYEGYDNGSIARVACRS